MKHKKKLGRILIPILIIAVIAGGLAAWYFLGQSSAEPVNAYPFMYLGMTEYWGDSQESYGPVTTDKIQTVYLSETQTVTEILVAPGDTVQKGDLLMTFDTTLTDLALERERLQVEKLKLQLEDAKDRLKEIKGMKPMVIPTTPDKDEEVNLGTALDSPYRISVQSAYDGSSPEKALICWISGNTPVDSQIFDALRAAAVEYQTKNAPVVEPTEPVETEAPTEDPTVPPAEVPTEPPVEESTEPPVEEPTVPEATEPTEPEQVEVNRFYVILKVTEGDMSLGKTIAWQGMELTRDETTGSYGFKLFDASGITDHMLASSGETPEPKPEIDYGSGYTASQIAQMRSEQEKTIKDLQFQIKMAEADYKIKQTEVGDGSVYAEIDGQVVSVLSEEEAKMTFQPVLKVSGGGGFYVEGSVSELERDNLQLGQEVTINDWNTGMTYTGTIDSIGEFPGSSNGWNGMGNPNSSYYPFTVFIDGSADLQEGSYVSVMYSTATAEHGIYLQKPFLRTEGGQSYVYVLSEGKLEKRTVTTGKSLWGSYTEILSGLTEEDFIAFPYGKEVKDGAPAVECEDMSQLYG